MRDWKFAEEVIYHSCSIILVAIILGYIDYRIYAQPVASGSGLGGESLSASEYMRLVERLQDSPALGDDGVDAM